MEKPLAGRSLIPWPDSIDFGEPVADAPTPNLCWETVKTPRLENAVALFVGDRPLRLRICCENESGRYPVLGMDESYRLTVADSGVVLSASQEWGILRGLATLAQSETSVSVEIVDAPRFAWRGLMIDVARHFITTVTLQRTLQAMALYKLNVLHLHLSDDQAFRFPSQAFPRLNADAPFYSAAELKDLVAFAADLGIRVVPELDMPGHVNSWLVAYPEWGSQHTQSSVRFGGHKACLDVTKPETMQAVESLLGEIIEIFPDQYVHVGGDEVNPSWWQESTAIKAYMQQHGFAHTKDLHAYFNQCLHTWLTAENKIMLAWDEVLGQGLPLPVTVQSWRGATARNRALAQGADCVVSANYYLDFWYPADLYYRFDVGGEEVDLLVQEDELRLDPRLDHVQQGLELILPWRKGADSLNARPGRILGGEACLWTELVTDELVDARLWGCVPAIAEKFWSPEKALDVADLRGRLLASWQTLATLTNINMRDAVEGVCQKLNIDKSQMPLIEMLEPVKWYARLLGEEALNARLTGVEAPEVRPYHAGVELNKLADYLPPESTAAWQLSNAIDQYLENGETATLSDYAQSWQAALNHIHEIPEDLHPAAEHLVKVGNLLASILQKNLPADYQETLVLASKPCGQVLLANVPVLFYLTGKIRDAS